jgi:nucleotide-binding universal stress UspA family protein
MSVPLIIDISPFNPRIVIRRILMSTWQSILVATDFSELGQRAVKVAFELASKLDSKVHVVHVFTLQGSPEPASLATEALRNEEKISANKLLAAADEYRASGRLGEVQTRVGDPAPMILRTAEELHADLVVMGTHGRSGLPRLLLGSTAERVLRQAACTVVIVKK